MSLPTSQMTDTILREPKSGDTGLGPSYGAQQTITGVRVEQINKQQTDALGRIIVADLRIFSPPEKPFTVGDKLAYDGVYYNAIRVDKLVMFSRVHHYEVLASRAGTGT